MSLYHVNKEGEIMYAVMGEGFDRRRRRWVPLPIEHVHAADHFEARNKYRAGQKYIRIVNVAPAIGFFANEHGEEVSA